MSQVSLPVERNFSFSQLKETVSSVIQDQMEKMELRGRAFMTSLSINNYLKSQEEIENDFLAERLSLAFPNDTRNNRDGYLNIHNPERIDSGYMEENY